MEITSLREAGLTEGEIKVYLALLKLGPSTTGPIVDKSKISRSIIYQILEKLIDKGLVSYIVKEKTNYYQAANPNKILEYIEEREKSLQENKKRVETMLPDLFLLKETAKASEAQIYQGFKGTQTAFQGTYKKLRKGDFYYVIGVPGIQSEKYHMFYQRDHSQREKAGIKCKLLFNQDTPRKVLRNRNSYKGCDARYMPLPTRSPAWFLIYKDVTVIVLQSKEMGIEIVDQEIADSFQAYFDEFWKQSKPFKNQ